MKEEGSLRVRGYSIWYGVSKAADDRSSALPVVVLHGGPGVPSHYLEPLEGLNQMGGRSVFFYDQLGCGRSDEPEEEEFYSVRQSAEDAATMLSHFAEFHGLLEAGGFHLLGHSWGGCLAAEVVMRHLAHHPKLLSGLKSVILASSPASPAESQERATKIIDEYKRELDGLSPDELGMRPDWPREKDWVEQWKLQVANDKFTTMHNLRLKSSPLCLQEAFCHLGVVWRGATSVGDFRIDQKDLESKWPRNLPALVMRGEHDYISKELVAPFVEGIERAEYAELAGLSHMAHLEDPRRFLATVDGWLRKVEKAGR